MIRPPLTPRKANDPLASVVLPLRWVLSLRMALIIALATGFPASSTTFPVTL